jgi:hypothetical protein
MAAEVPLLPARPAEARMALLDHADATIRTIERRYSSGPAAFWRAVCAPAAGGAVDAAGTETGR